MAIQNEPSEMDALLFETVPEDRLVYAPDMEMRLRGIEVRLEIILEKLDMLVEASEVGEFLGTKR